ncbi:protein maelstrom homolog [Bradysia coprophila]|uniref:protein maelstrom homolog n=1 Tax=Bradysia coprophila TaxID=38358 RepID=UPI00187D9FBD|nr:protein maelstrom homolog [Bradysia coprophila]
MSKQCTKDAFYFYKLRFEKENKGKVFSKGITNIEVAARESWRSMTLQKRDPYEVLAKEAASTQKTGPKVDKTVMSESLIESENNKIVNEMVRRSVVNNTVQTNEYYFIAANIFCETGVNKYLPAEIALLKYTLQDGVIRTYHTFVNPETIPMGYKFIALELSETTHQLPLPPNAMGEKDFDIIQQEIYKFIGNAPTCKQGFIPLFTVAEDVRMVELICEDLLGSTSDQAINRRYKTMSIDQLLFDLKTSIGRAQKREPFSGESQFKSVDDATSQLNREKYKFLSEIACEFHDEKDCSKYCCLSNVKRWAYVFSENISVDLKIPLVGGKHFPIGAENPVPSVELNCAHNKSTANVTVAGAHRKSKCDQKYNLNTNLYSQEVESYSSRIDSLPAVTRNRRPRNYFSGENYVRQDFGRGRGMRRG